MNNYNLDIKRTFLSFAQALFAEHPKYTWNIDPALTKVLIVDKHVVNLNVIEKKRSIVLSRGTYGWKYTSIGQRGYDENLNMLEDRLGNKRYTDLIRGSVTFNCIAQNGLVAEDMAHILFANLTGCRDQFKKNGIHQINNINIGEETLLKTDSSIEVTAVPIYVQFETQKSLGIGVDVYDSLKIFDQTGKVYFQGADYLINSGKIFYYDAPQTGTTLTIEYKHAVTLETISEPLIGNIDGVNKEFAYTYLAYTEYPILTDTFVTISGIEHDI